MSAWEARGSLALSRKSRKIQGILRAHRTVFFFLGIFLKNFFGEEVQGFLKVMKCAPAKLL